jgi:hypothetical protein
MLVLYGALCAWTLARAHARSSGAARVSSYLGTTGEFAEAITDFAVDYAIQNERDYESFLAAVKGGRVFATPGF